MIAIVVAYANNGVIGNKNDLPWHLPADLKRFRKLTTGNSVLMGRKTFDSITSRLGHPLPNRTNIVVTRDADYASDGVKVSHSLPEAFALADAAADTFVIGGAQIFDQTLALADRIYATEVQADIEGDTYFKFNRNDWREVDRDKHLADDKNQYDYDFATYVRA